MSKFKPGDKVVCVDRGDRSLVNGQEYIVQSIGGDPEEEQHVGVLINDREGAIVVGMFWAWRFGFVSHLLDEAVEEYEDILKGQELFHGEQ